MPEYTSTCERCAAIGHACGGLRHHGPMQRPSIRPCTRHARCLNEILKDAHLKTSQGSTCPKSGVYQCMERPSMGKVQMLAN
uniref:Uncharacterized protein n=1 Tax=Romanomermis culicivorax TaxID=13658 RepID=A0A915JKQ9_ROMCU